MGIFEINKTNGGLFGIRLYIKDNDELNPITLFELKQDILMSEEQIKKVYLFYETSQNKPNLLFEIYTQCSSTLYENGVFKMWYKIEAHHFLQLFNKKKH